MPISFCSQSDVSACDSRRTSVSLQLGIASGSTESSTLTKSNDRQQDARRASGCLVAFSMPHVANHYLLFAEASICPVESTSRRGRWRFVLESVDEQERLAATGDEPEVCDDRLELLAVVRGLEAIDGAARITLVTKSRYVYRGLHRGLAEWRRNNWRWERFGVLAPVRNADLWQRVDRALKFHEVECRLWQFGPRRTAAGAPADGASPEARRRFDTPPEPKRSGVSRGPKRGRYARREGLVDAARRRLGEAARTLQPGQGTAVAGG